MENILGKDGNGVRRLVDMLDAGCWIGIGIDMIGLRFVAAGNSLHLASYIEEYRGVWTADHTEPRTIITQCLKLRVSTTIRL
ncbi:hypothetical protein KQX54_005196 [Cotesia glomerata]|uniref:Uncharacterized protein n=1 Tax=Cotesia glomerata TaxID=32391 RepID=A0AAV7I713_COTGL|nr:hypothetical protein KQX54_005196 [Cotesia glomerata]